MTQQTLYIIYNADSTAMGKLRYGFRKLSSKPSDQPACAACDITHGRTLSLTESPAWVAARQEIEARAGVKVVQWHRNEVASVLKEWTKSQDIRYPTVILDEGENEFRQVMSSSELAVCQGDSRVFVSELNSRGMLPKQSSL